MTLALIDGDIVAHRASAGHQVNIRWTEDGPASSHVDAQEAARAAVDTVAAWSALAKCKSQIVCLTGKRNFRKLVLPSYKSNRKGMVKPLAWSYTIDALKDAYETRLVEGLEADDLLGILATTDKYAGAVIVTLDKDLRTVPGLHLNPLKDKRPHMVTPAIAERSWLLQALSGDAVDGYTGIPGVGPAKAAKVLDTPTTTTDTGVLWERVTRAYGAAGLTEDDALAQARVARILQRQDYDKETKCILLWHPSEPVRYPLASVLAGQPPDLPTNA